MCIFFSLLGNFLNKIPALSLSFSSPSGTPIMQILVASWCPIIHIGFLHIFFILLFFSYDRIISNDVFKSTDSFFCLIKLAVDTLYCICFLSFIVSSAPEFVWFFLLFLFLCWTSHFVHILFFLTLFSCLHVFSWNSPTFLKEIILNYSVQRSSIL